MEPPAPRKLTDDDMPALFSDADATSLSAQRTYLRLIQVDIGLVILAAGVGSFSPNDPVLKTLVAFATALLFVLSIVLSAVLAIRRYEKRWYGGRAVAESVKTIAWRYSIRAEPYDIEDNAADARFVSELRAILDDKKHLAVALTGNPITREPHHITEGMRELRALDTKSRLAAYLSGRVDNQRDWYRRKSSTSGIAENKWFALIVVSQVLGVCAALALVRWPNTPVNAVGFFAAVATASAAWMQVRRHQELAQSYAIATQELGLIHEGGGRVTTNEQLSVFVSDAENAISREHTLWTARRDT